MNPDDTELGAKLQTRFQELPKVVQEAITSADVEKRLRALADTKKLHLDQWEALENEVMLALLGFQPIEQLEANIVSHVRVTTDAARELASEISTMVFEPIRGELERSLEHPEAKATEVSEVEQVRAQAIRAEAARIAPPAVPIVSVTPAESAPSLTSVPATSTATIPTPATVPQSDTAALPTPEPQVPVPLKVERAPASSSYAAQVPSVTRKSIEGDPYREQLA